ncbi:MAG: TonB-dependent receptor, partial [Planctomycetota bacterium]|nr:TonB-dependent receptor [Planctomycetota bacterium]
TQYGEIVDVPRTHRTIYMKSWYRTTIGTNRVEEYNNYRSLSYIQLKAQKLSGFIDTAKLSLSFQNLHNYVVTLRSGSTVYNYNGFDVGTLGFFAIAATPKTSYGRFSFGMESYSDNIDSSRYTKNIATNVRTEYARGEVADDSKYILSGLFIQNEFSAAKWLDLTAGIRYTYASLDAGVVDPDPTDAFPYEPFKSSYDALVCSFRALLRLKEEKETASRIIFGVSQGFRAPNLDDTTTFRPVATASHDIPSPDVKPEYCTNFEIGYRELKKGENKSSLLELFYFYNNLQDFIERVPTTYAGSPTDPAGRQYYAKENFSSGYIHGVEFSLEWSHKLEKWMENTAGVGRFTFSWTEGYG